MALHIQLYSNVTIRKLTSNQANFLISLFSTFHPVCNIGTRTFVQLTSEKDEIVNTKENTTHVMSNSLN